MMRGSRIKFGIGIGMVMMIAILMSGVVGFEIRIPDLNRYIANRLRGESNYRMRLPNCFRVIESAKEQAAIEAGLENGDVVPLPMMDDYLPPYIKRSDDGLVRCPDCGASLIYNPIGLTPFCSGEGRRIRPRALVFHDWNPKYWRYHDGMHVKVLR